MDTIKKGPTAFNAQVVARQTKDAFIAKEKDRQFSGLSEEERIKRLGEVWEQCNAAINPPATLPALPAEEKKKKRQETAPEQVS